MQHGLVASIAALALAVPLFGHASNADDETAAIVHLGFRDHIVTNSSSPRGPLYSVRTPSGELLNENLTDQELLAAHPELYSHIRSGVAGDDSASFVWAGRDETSVESPKPFSVDTE